MSADQPIITRRSIISAVAGLSVAGTVVPARAQFSFDLGKLGDIGRMLKGLNLKEKDEMALGADLFGALIKTMGGVYKNRSVQKDLSSIAARLFETSARKAFSWEAVVVDNNEVNAWALPGGKIGVNKGLLRYVDSEDELAAALAHEMGHAEFSHAAKEMKKKAFYAGLSTAAQAAAVAAADNRSSRIGAGAGMESIALPMLRLVTSGYSRELEYQADSYIVDVFKKVGFDVMRGAKFYETLLDIIPKNAKGTTSLFAGHPQTQKRLEALREAGANAPHADVMFDPNYYTLKQAFPTRKIYKRTAG